MGPNELVVRIERVWARDAAALAGVLAQQDSTWRSQSFPLSGGYVVWCGQGLYVNQALAVGYDDPLTDDDLEQLIQRSRIVGVPPAIETTSATAPETVARLGAHGFVSSTGTTSALVLESAVPHARDSTIEIVPVSVRSLADWQRVSAAGWGHASPAARRAADAFARAAQVLDGDGMVIAEDREDGRSLGCASLTIREDVATLGGMSTIPEERGRGVQSALIRHRIAVARQQGCDVITASAESGSASERNLIRHGFRVLHTKLVHRLPAT